MANAGQSRATSPLFFLKTGCLNKVLYQATGQPLISSTEIIYEIYVLLKTNELC